ncbi:hypothetical protein ASG38_03475 [Flavobacterium sp. Leaf359]|uniref:hypothetical protein n=1 Tax=Flavobacterium sp. Leaf359 TaxID=1736351 RepID=UPI0007017067|nr:hypothetical protein [Flavobacterium sp. Leaf359]KQS50051.1 hypothetical protein ASG38_03475 [Flavobacterium sp. Leaf359]
MDTLIKISGYVRTDFIGINKLYDFYRSASQYQKRNIVLDFNELKFLDGNLCALFISLMYKLMIERDLTFSTNHSFIKEKFNVLIRNGFIKTDEKINDVQKSTLHLKHFDIKNLDDFVGYVQQDLMQHRGLNLREDIADKIMDSIIEIATNIEIHSNTQHPFFACGQFFPDNKIFKFSMVDLGDGFLPAINKHTSGLISTSHDAIKWAIGGNTTKTNEPGGLGLSGLNEYFSNNNGHLQIITGDAFWSTELQLQNHSGKKFDIPCCGTMINLLFIYN